MKLLLTMLLCLASLINGTSSYPAAPESAATYAIDELSLSDGSESATLPGIRADVALGTELSELHLEAEGDGGGAAELTLQLAPDGLRFALGDHESAYFVPDAEATELFNFGLSDSADPSEFEALRQLLPPSFALLGACLRDTSIAMRAVQCAADALCEGKASEESNVRFEGGNMPTDCVTTVLDSQSVLKVLGALRESDIPEIQPLLNVLIPMYSLAQLPSLTQKAESDFSLALNVHRHVDMYEGFTYTRIESADAEDPFTDRVLECEVVDYEDFSYLSLSCVDARYDGDLIEYQMWVSHSYDGDDITASVQSDDIGISSFTMENICDGQQIGGTCVLSHQLPDNELVDEDYNPIPNESLKLDYSIADDGDVGFSLEGRSFTELDFGLNLHAIPSQADFQSRVDGLREVPVSASDFSSEAFASGESALSADAMALEQFLKQYCSDAGIQALESILALPFYAFDALF